MKYNLLSGLILIIAFINAVNANEPKTLEWDELMPPGYVESI